ncbi:hypothetical protein VTO42DRAFT_8478 [Malbranchea cinnamomea]
MSNDDDDYFLPLEDQRVFGAGIRRKRIAFVPSSESNLQTTSSISAPATTSTTPSPGELVAGKYLSIVLSSRASSDTTSITAPKSSSTSEKPTVTCDICNLPLPVGNGEGDKKARHSHESSLAHQVCLPHSQPPSAIDRTRKGYKYLSAYGWDPDSRKGLGVDGQGITTPLKAKIKSDTTGLGVKVPEGGSKVSKKREVKLNAKQVRKMEAEKRRKQEKLREMFYRPEDVQKYLDG